MGSRKGSAKAKQIARFKAGLGGMDDLFAKEEALRRKACESKNRYASRMEAEDAIRSCEEYGRRGLRCYKCPHCNGWHLTSKGEL